MANYGPPLVDFSSLGRLGETFTSAFDKAQKQTAMAEAGQALNSGNYKVAAAKLAGLGDMSSAAALLALEQKSADSSNDARVLQSVFGGGNASAPATAAPPTSLGNPTEIENRFIGSVKGAGLTNPYGLGAVAAYGRAESGFSPANANRVWNDPSESGQPGQAGGIMSWRADRLANLQRFASERGEKPGSISPETQGAFLIAEDPQLLPRLQAAKSPDEANQIMANAWRFAGYDRPGGENARRLAMTRAYAGRFGQAGGPAAPPAGAPAAGVQVAQAPAAPNDPRADMPSVGAAEAQGFVIPGTGQVVDQQTIASNPRIQNMVRALGMVKGDQARAAIRQQLELEVADLKAKQAQNAPTDVQRNFVAAQRDPAFREFLKEQRASTTVNVDQKGEGEYAKTVGKSLGERMDAISKEGDSARQDSVLLGQLREIGGKITNMGAGAALQARLQQFGINVGPNTDEIAAFGAIVDKLTPQQRVPGTGASSDLDVRMFKSALPNLIRTPGGNELILSTLEAVSQDKAARAAIADRALTGELKPQDAIKELRALPDPMAALKDARKDGFKSLPQMQQERKAPEPPKAPEAPSQFREGQRARGPNGQIIIFRNGQWGAQ